MLALCMIGLSVGMYLIYFENLVKAGSIVSITSLFLYLASFSPGMGPQPWTVNSEIYPLHLRGTAVSLSTTANWLANYLVSSVFLSTTATDTGKVASYSVIAVFCVLAFIFIFFLLPETKEKSLDEIVMLFNPKLAEHVAHTRPTETGGEEEGIIIPQFNEGEDEEKKCN